MVAPLTVSEEILALKIERRAVILAHHYQEPEIQDLADCVGDALDLVRAAERLAGEVIVLCGVRPIAELMKVLNPSRTVIIPDKYAGCSLADGCPVEGVRAFRRRNPGYVVVCHMNTSAAVKAESDILCTTDNAIAVVNSIPADRPILFLPDINLGSHVQRQTGRRTMKVWQGACIVHATFPARRLVAARAEHPRALIAAHPECPGEVLRMAHFVGSAAAIIEWCLEQPGEQFILVAESGIRHSLERRAPGKRFYFVANENCNCSECPYMRLNSLEKLVACLEKLEPRIELEEEVMRRAVVPFERMLAVV